MALGGPPTCSSYLCCCWRSVNPVTSRASPARWRHSLHCFPALTPHKHRLLWLRVPTRSRREGLPCRLMVGPGLQHTVAGARMLTQTHVASSCGLVSVARARRGEGGCSAGVHSVCPCYIARHFAGFLLTQAVKGKLFLLGKFCFSLTLSQGPLLLEFWLCTRQVAPAAG